MMEQFPNKLFETVVRIRRTIHEHPELSNQEHRTSAFIKEVLLSHGISNITTLGSTSFAVKIQGQQSCPATTRLNRDFASCKTARYVFAGQAKNGVNSKFEKNPHIRMPVRNQALMESDSPFQIALATPKLLDEFFRFEYL